MTAMNQRLFHPQGFLARANSGLLNCFLWQLRENEDAEEFDEPGGPLDVEEVHLRLSHLQSLHQQNVDGDKSTFANNGADPKRLKQVIHSPPCSCQCRMPLATLQAVCRCFMGPAKDFAGCIVVAVDVLIRAQEDLGD